MDNSSVKKSVSERCKGLMILSKIRDKFQHYIRRWKSYRLINLNKFATYDEIVSYMESVNEGTLEELGVTHEGRRILGIRIGEGPTCILEAGIHGREWAAPMAALYVIGRLLNGPPMGVAWIVIPLLNPDGYEYSHRVQRLWRKNTRRTGNPMCPGVDINRNFSVQWGKVSGCSKEPCSPCYCGPDEWSELESRAIRDLVLRTKDLKVYLSVHSCLQAIMYPPAHTIKPSKDLSDLEDVAIEAQEKILNNCGTFYIVGQSSLIDRIASGSSIDWVRETIGIKFAYNIELPGPEVGFVLPESEVEQVGKELYEAVKVFSKAARDL